MSGTGLAFATVGSAAELSTVRSKTKPVSVAVILLGKDETGDLHDTNRARVHHPKMPVVTALLSQLNKGGFWKRYL